MRLAGLIICVVCLSLFIGTIASAQDKKVEENWKEFQQLWKDITSEEGEEDKDGEEANPFGIPGLGSGGPKQLSDGKLKSYAKMGTLFEKAGFFKDEAGPEAKALKALFKIAIDPPSDRQQGPIVVQIQGMGGREDAFKKGYESFKEGLESNDKDDIKKGLKKMKVLKGLEDKEQDRVVEVILALAGGKDYPK